MASDKGYPRIDGRNNGYAERRGIPKITPGAVFALSPGYARLPDGLKFVYAMVFCSQKGNMM